MQQSAAFARVLKVAGPVALVVVVAFATGARREAGRLASAEARLAEVRTAIEEGRELIDGLPGGTNVAPGETVPRQMPSSADEVRLAFPQALTALAARVGIESLELTESAGEDSEADPDVFDEDEWSEGEEGDVESAGSGSREPFARHAYALRFVGTYDAVARFVDALATTSSVVGLESIRIARAVPGLEVEMVVSAYRRTG